MTTEPKFKILKKPEAGQPGVALYSVVRNEMYFMPHFLRHYRALGIREFWFLDDRSSDGTREFLRAQPDCGVIECNMSFGDMVGQMRLGTASKTLIPRALLQGRWVLTVDADEFLLLPRSFSNLDELVSALGKNELSAARALMLDFYPACLRQLESATPQDSPFALCPNFDAYAVLDWPDRTPQPSAISQGDGVRARMLAHLYDIGAAQGDLFKSYKYPNVNKVPLLFWREDTQMLSAHRSNVLPSDQIQLVLAHFKFYPGYRDRIADALLTNAYWQNSSEYRFLDIATRELLDWPLGGPLTRQFAGPQALERAGLLFNHLHGGPNVGRGSPER